MCMSTPQNYISTDVDILHPQWKFPVLGQHPGAAGGPCPANQSDLFCEN